MFKEFLIKYLSFIYILHNLYIKNKYYIKRDTYADSGEDKFILKKIKKGKFYVDVGCHHPLRINNCHLLYENNWRGVNIDINEVSIKIFDYVRREDLNVNSAVSLSKGYVNYFYDKPLSGYTSLIKKKDLKKTKKIKSNRLDSILDSTKYKNKKIDFLSIDAEGKDFDVLKSLDFKRYEPKSICIEIWGKAKKKNFNLKKNSIYKFLKKKKYRLAFNEKENYIFLKN